VPTSEVARLYRLGLTMAEIAGAYGVSEWTVASRLDRAGLARRARDDHAALAVEEAVRAYLGQPDRLAELAGGLGVSAQLITSRARRPPRGRRGQRRDRADVPAAEVAGLYRAGWTVTQIAAAYRAATSTVLRRLDQAGVTRRPPSARASFPVAEAVRRAQQGASVAELAVTTRWGSMRSVGGCGPRASTRRAAACRGRWPVSPPRSWRGCMGPG
jgi:hypothetical protein